MIFLYVHGRRAGPTTSPATAKRPAEASIRSACGFCHEDIPESPSFGRFGYYFKSAPDATGGKHRTEAIEALARAMVEARPDDANNSQIPPVFTYLGQFIDHDVTANTDRETGISTIDTDVIETADRETVASDLVNLRAGALNLDSLYGGGPVQGDFARRLQDALRFPGDRAKLWAGTDFDAGLGRVPLPSDPARDLLRLGRIVSAPDAPFSPEDFQGLPDDLREPFVNSDGSLRVQRAILGDSRNDENLVVAQLHLAFVRLHNVIVLHAEDFVADASDRDAVFAWARRMVTWTYQWLVMNVYLPTVCDAGIVREVIEQRAPLYAQFLAENPPVQDDLLPMPLEFSVAAFRFGHTMVRSEYDWSGFFGEGGSFSERATFRQLFEFTGGAVEPMPLPGGGSAPRLPSHWPVEWARLALPVPETAPHRSARRIDTFLAEPLNDMENESPDENSVLRRLAERNLRRGLRLNLPSAQDCIAGIEDATGVKIPALSASELTSGHTGPAVDAGGFVEETPLWFYVLKEAELYGQKGDPEKTGRLGPLGSRLVAETLAGLIIYDSKSYWAQPGSGPGNRWQPEDGVEPGGEPIRSIEALLRAARVL